MNVIKISVGDRAQPVVEKYTIAGDLESLQEQVGGYVERVPGKGEGYCLLINEEGKMRGQAINFLATLLTPLFGDDWIVGTALIVGDDGGPEFSDVPFHVEEALLTLWGAR